MPKKKKSSKRGKQSGSGGFNPFKIVDMIQSGIMYILGKLAYLFLFVIVFAFLVSIVNNKLNNYPLVTLVNNVGLMFTALVAALTSGRLEVIGSVIANIFLYFGYSVVQTLQFSIQISFQIIGGGIYGLLGQTGDIHFSTVFAGIGGDFYISLTNLGFLFSLDNVLGFSVKIAWTFAGGTDLASNVLLAFNKQAFANMLSFKFVLSFGGDITVPDSVLAFGINTKVSDYLGANNSIGIPKDILDTKFSLTVGDILKPIKLDKITIPIPNEIINPINDFLNLVKKAMKFEITPAIPATSTCPVYQFGSCWSGWINTPYIAAVTVNDTIYNLSLQTIDIVKAIPTFPTEFGYSLGKDILDQGPNFTIESIFTTLNLPTSIAIPDIIANIGIDITIQSIFDTLGLAYTFTLPSVSLDPGTLSLGDVLTGLTASAPTDWYKIIKSITG